jgi:hypothetical protein
MKNSDKLTENIMKIIKIEGFYINFSGDMSVGISDAEWELTGGFYFDDQEELEEFRGNLKNMFANYCGENCLIETFEERQIQIDRELENQ